MKTQKTNKISSSSFFPQFPASPIRRPTQEDLQELPIPARKVLLLPHTRQAMRHTVAKVYQTHEPEEASESHFDERVQGRRHRGVRGAHAGVICEREKKLMMMMMMIIEMMNLLCFDGIFSNLNFFKLNFELTVE
jgi:hypothetical protein